MSPDSSHRPLRERFRDQARTEVLEAALRVFVRDGLREARIDAIAAEAGVSVGTVYNLYGDRAGLVAAAIERVKAEFRELVRVFAATSTGAPFEERLRGLTHLLVGHMRAQWPMLRMLSEAEGPAALASQRPSPSMIREMHTLVSGMIQQGIDDGTLAPVDPHVATCALMGAIRNTIDVDLGLGLEPPSEARADAIVALFLHGTARR